MPYPNMDMHEVVPDKPEQAPRNNFTVWVYGKSALETNSSAIPSNLEHTEVSAYEITYKGA